MPNPIDSDRLPPYLAFGWLDRWSIHETDDGAAEAVYVDGEDIAYRVHWAPAECRLTEYLDGREIASASGVDLTTALSELGRTQLEDESNGSPPFYARMQRHMADRVVMDKPRRMDTRRMTFPGLLLAWVTLFVPQGTPVPVPRVRGIPETHDDDRFLGALAPNTVHDAARLTCQPGGSIAVERGKLASWSRPALMVEELLDALGDLAARDRPRLDQPHSAFCEGHLGVMWFTGNRRRLPVAAFAVAGEGFELGRAIERTGEELRNVHSWTAGTRATHPAGTRS